MNQREQATHFAKLHVRGKPLILYNAWDSGSAKSILVAGAEAIATSSWAIAQAQGYRDGEVIPIAFVERIVGRIAATIDVPVTVDFEGGYSDNDRELADNVSHLLDLGVVGINFEDRIVRGSGLYDTIRQARRIEAVRKAAERKGIELFINARTDLFLGRKYDPEHTAHAGIGRANVYAAAGASGFFVPGLRDEALIGRICSGTALPVNVMMMDGVPSIARLTELGVARISFGAIPYVRAMGALEQDAERVLSQ